MRPDHDHHTSRRPTGRLALEDGTVFTGRAFGATDDPASKTGEVVFNTAMTGYQEALTDPSYSGQILTMTTPLIGNYGVSVEDVESGGPRVAGFVVRELARRHSNHRAVGDLSGWLREGGVVGIEGVDTRALVRRLRIHGAMRGAITCDEALTDGELIRMAIGSPVMSGMNLAREASPRQPSVWSADLGRWRDQVNDSSDGAGLRVVALDCGAKQNIYRHFAERGCIVQVVPWDTTADAIRQLRPDGLFISNGPGDPAAVAAAIETLRALVGEIPTFGICLGHQLLALALGATTYKLKFGHRGANQPVCNTVIGRVEITSQNHGFCVDAASLEASGCEVTHVHLNDGTVAGFRHRTRPIIAVQHHPEASPGPHDAAYLFDCFVEMMHTGRPLTVEQMTAARTRAGRAGVG